MPMSGNYATFESQSGLRVIEEALLGFREGFECSG